MIDINIDKNYSKLVKFEDIPNETMFEVRGKDASSIYYKVNEKIAIGLTSFKVYNYPDHFTNYPIYFVASKNSVVNITITQQ